MSHRVVIDTNVFVSALRSSRGASYHLLRAVGQADFEIVISVPLVIEYEDAAKRMSDVTGLSDTDVDDVIDYLCSVAGHQQIHFLWRPFLRDSRDDHVLELAVEADCDLILTHNVKDFGGCEQFGVKAIRPGAFLKMIGESS